MAFNTKQHDRVINNTLDDIRSGVFDSISALENEIALLVSQGYDPQTIRPQVLAAFKKWSLASRQAVAPVTNLSEDWMKQTGFATSQADLQAQTILAEQTANTVANSIDSTAENILEVIALGAAAGLATTTITQQVRGKISGVQMESDNPLVRREQRALRKLMRTGATAGEMGVVIAKIRRLTPNINTANSVRDQASKTVDASVVNFDGAYASGVSERQGVTKWRYSGGEMETTRPFCSGMIGQELTRDEIDSIWGDSWAGKEPGDPMVVRGGYNCQHYWVPVEED